LQFDPSQNFAGEAFVLSKDAGGGTDIQAVSKMAVLKLSISLTGPHCWLIADANGDLFGTTAVAITVGSGTVFN